MDLQNKVRFELHKIHRSRNRVGYLPHLLCLFISAYFQRAQLPMDGRWILALSLVCIGTFMRILMNEAFFTEWSNNVKWARYFNLFSFFILALGWGFHYSDILFHYGGDSSNLAYTMLLMIAFITGSSTSLIADKGSYYTFVVTLSFSVFIPYITNPNLSNGAMSLNIFLFLLFSMGSFKVAHKQLLDLVTSQLTSLNEKRTLENMINTVPGFVGFIGADLVCTMANKETVSVFPHIVGNKIGEIDNNAEWEQFIINFIRSNKSSEISEQHAVYQGRDIHALLKVQKTLNKGVIVVSIITTDLVEAKKRIREQEAKAQYSAKLASLGEMVAEIAHEINNPLTVIQGSANIINRLVDQQPVDLPMIKLLNQKMMETSDRIFKTIKSLKAQSRQGDKDPKTIFPLMDSINNSIELCGHKFKSIGVELKKDDLVPAVNIYGREVQISQVLINLISNAMDAVRDLNEKWVEIKMEKTDNAVHIYVIDSGTGIPDEIQQKIMEPFFTTKAVNKGTGLGLSISKNIIKEHDGELAVVDGNPNTTFRVSLPLATI